MIQEPCEELKEIQTSIAQELSLLEPSPFAHGFVTGRDFISNASVHRAQPYVLKMDIKDFFPSLRWEVVSRELTRNYDFPTDLLNDIEKYCFLDGGLPQGAPSSPVISNLVMWSFDMLMGIEASSLGLLFTRYADDSVFSGGEDLSLLDRYLEGKVADALLVLGLRLNKKKTKLMPYYQRQLVTGVVVNNPETSVIRRDREAFFLSHKGKIYSDLTDSELGWLAHLAHVNQGQYERLCKKLCWMP